ncbi:MAG: hypothetical protein Q8K60_03795 [Parachlamydiaceae bacterium]|nr:hypothetical protein [Parachlamydiaceae bacterium]
MNIYRTSDNLPSDLIIDLIDKQPIKQLEFDKGRHSLILGSEQQENVDFVFATIKEKMNNSNFNNELNFLKPIKLVSNTINDINKEVTNKLGNSKLKFLLTALSISVIALGVISVTGLIFSVGYISIPLVFMLSLLFVSIPTIFSIMGSILIINKKSPMEYDKQLKALSADFEVELNAFKGSPENYKLKEVLAQYYSESSNQTKTEYHELIKMERDHLNDKKNVEKASRYKMQRQKVNFLCKNEQILNFLIDILDVKIERRPLTF